MSSSFGTFLKLSIFGSSHGPQIGMSLENIPKGLHVDLQKLQLFLDRRAPGRNPWSTTRKEADIPLFQSGLTENKTNGEVIIAVIQNSNHKSSDYSNFVHIPRPGHADYAAWTKYGMDYDMTGGGAFSGRMTAPLCIAGGMCKQWLEQQGIRIGAHIGQIHHVADVRFNPLSPELNQIQDDFPVLSADQGAQMKVVIEDARKQGDSLGGTIECAITGVPAGLGDMLFGGLEGKIAQAIYGIPGVKGVDFGLGFDNALHCGSFVNDPFTLVDRKIVTATNHCGGILGGISNAMPILFRVAVKPTPSISKPQKSVNMDTMEEVSLQIQGRHDPCIVPRAVPVVEAAAALALFDVILANQYRKE